MPAATDTAQDLRTRPTLKNYEDIANAIGLRKITTQSEEFQAGDGSTIRRASSTAVIKNPWIGTSTSHDLAEATEKIAPLLAKLLTERVLAVLGGAAAVEAFGKAALVGENGELEHAGALIHTPYFGNLVREALEGTSILCFTDGRSAADTSLKVPMWHKTQAATRSHYQTIDVQYIDAPHADEIAVTVAASTGPRPHARIGDRTTDKPVTWDILKEITL